MVSVKSVHGSAQLLLDVAGGVTQIVEKMHSTIAREANPLNRLRDLAGVPPEERRRRTYQVIQSTTSLLQLGLHQSLNKFSVQEEILHSSQSVKVAAALNGVCGDHLEASNNPLAIAMHFRNAHGDKVSPGSDNVATMVPDASSRIVVLVHGLCLSHEYWKSHDEGNLGTELQRAHGFTPLYLNYNTGRHISSNGRELSNQLQDLVEAWPVEVEELALIGHSMGGLVIRSASWYGSELNLPWTRLLKNALYLGSPHHGSAVAKAGNMLTFVMKKFRYASPFALGQHTSAGIKDLRHGNLLDEDWEGINQDDFHPDYRKPVPLQEGTRHYFIAATIGKHVSTFTSMMVGDLLVRLDSAKGHHSDDLKKLSIRPEDCRVFENLNHLDLLDNKVVHDQVLEWLA
ncbi:PGAP1-like protein [Marinobacter sp. LV10R510-11A]|uniref:esterase/lipase family protein n=1 Tax=Marinobacter sp. LV10R510-11A TaxID=1415568 RepID=UPI000BB95A27|nr:alpha/beta fold hydrolase [Marinobacter sp. LV10R510-11A]SOB75541.1 PGAP1-like protein [Marinobacter sp. LV10R510-11A]